MGECKVTHQFKYILYLAIFNRFILRSFVNKSLPLSKWYHHQNDIGWPLFQWTSFKIGMSFLSAFLIHTPSQPVSKDYVQNLYYVPVLSITLSLPPSIFHKSNYICLLTVSIYLNSLLYLFYNSQESLTICRLIIPYFDL